jgi:hypothetical protein
MPIGKIGSSPSTSVPDLNEIDSNPQSVAAATGDKGGIGHRAVQSIVGGLSKLSAGIRHVADSFANAIESRFSGSAKDNLKSLFHRGPKQIETPIELKTFKTHIDDTYAQIANSSFENSTYGDVADLATKSDDYALADEPSHASLSDIQTRPRLDEPVYANTGESQPADTFEPIYQNISTRAEVDSEEYVEAAPQEVYASLSEIATEATASLSDLSINDFGGFKPDATQPADTQFYARVDSNSSPATKQAINFVKTVIDQHGAAGGKALDEAGIFRDKRVIGQITPKLFNAFQVKLKEAKAANAAKVAAGFAPSAAKIKYDRYNSDNADSPIHDVLQKAIFTSSPKLADKAKWLFDEILSKGGSSASVQDLAQGVAKKVVAEKLKEAYDAGRSDSPFHDVFADSALANTTGKKLENIKFEYDQVLADFAFDHIAEGGLDRPFNPDAFRDLAVAAAKVTIEKYTF